jgi:hypothetical protein
MKLVISWCVSLGGHVASFVFKRYKNEWRFRKREAALYQASSNFPAKQSLSSAQAFKMICCMVTARPSSPRTQIHMRRSFLMGSSWLGVPLKIIFLIFFCAATSIRTLADHLMSSKCAMSSSAAAPRRESLWSLLSQQHSSSTWSFWQTACHKPFAQPRSSTMRKECAVFK